jgi:SAM-dependent methyltransferase
MMRRDGRLNDYDSLAEAYAAENETNLVNAYYERPAMLELAGDVAGRRILDVGCGTGPLSAALRDRGAVVTGIDVSAEMLKLARRSSAPTRTCGSPTWPTHCPSPATLSTTWSRRWCCTTWRTGGRRWPSSGAC